MFFSGISEAGFDRLIISKDTLPETNMAPENGWLKDEFPFGSRPISKGYVSFREGMYKKCLMHHGITLINATQTHFRIAIILILICHLLMFIINFA